MRSEEFTKSKPEVFVDMDGVLADLFGFMEKRYKVDKYKNLPQGAWDKAFERSDAKELFANLPVFPTANQLLELVVKYAGSYNILSSPLNFDPENSIAGKNIWLDKNIKIPAKRRIFEREKYIYAKQPDGTPNILIDDFGHNTIAWKQHGGIAIKYKANKHPLSKVEDVLKEVYDKY